MTKEKRCEFSAILERTSCLFAGIERSGYYLKDVRTRVGELVRSHFIPVLEIDDQELLQDMGSGDYVAFVADVELKNAKLILPSKRNKVT